MSDDDLARIDLALRRMRRLWSHALRGDAFAGQLDGPVHLSHVLVADAVAQLGNGSEATVGRIAEHLDVERSTASRLVDSASRAGWVSTHSSTADRRRTVVALTPAGVALVAHASQFRHDYLRRLLDGWSEADVTDLARLLARFAVAVAEQPPAPGSGGPSVDPGRSATG